MEEQVEQQTQNRESAPAHGDGQDGAADAWKKRERQSLELQRERILDERTANPIRRAALEAALTEIEAKLTAL